MPNYKSGVRMIRIAVELFDRPLWMEIWWMSSLMRTALRVKFPDQQRKYREFLRFEPRSMDLDAIQRE